MKDLMDKERDVFRAMMAGMNKTRGRRKTIVQMCDDFDDGDTKCEGDAATGCNQKGDDELTHSVDGVDPPTHCSSAECHNGNVKIVETGLSKAKREKSDHHHHHHHHHHLHKKKDHKDHLSLVPEPVPEPEPEYEPPVDLELIAKQKEFEENKDKSVFGKMLAEDHDASASLTTENHNFKRNKRKLKVCHCQCCQCVLVVSRPCACNNIC